MMHAGRRRADGAVTLWMALLAAVLHGCGGSSGSSGPSTPSAANTPTVTPTPVRFTGNYAGIVGLSGGQTGTVALVVRSDETASGTFTISGGGVVALTGFVALSNGNFSTSGQLANASGPPTNVTVSGTLPSTSAGEGFLFVQIGTTFFSGTINAGTVPFPTRTPTTTPTPSPTVTPTATQTTS